MAKIILLILAILIGTGFGVILALGTWLKLLSKSNIMGFTTGGFHEFDGKVIYYISRDNVGFGDRDRFIRYYGREILRERGIEAPDMSYIDEQFPDDDDIPEVDIPLFKPLEYKKSP